MTREDIQNKVLSMLIKIDRGTAALSGGTGKTLIGLKHMDHMFVKGINDKFLVVAPKRSIFESWKDDAKKFNLEFLLEHITFSTYLSLNKQANDYNMIYLDECHSLKLSHNEWLSKFKGIIIGLTGTPPKDEKSERGFMVDKYCPVIYSYNTDQAVDHSILNDYRVVVHYVQLDKEKNVKVVKPQATWMTSEHAIYTYWSGRVDNSHGKMKQIAAIQRMKAMQGFFTKEVKAKNLLDSIGLYSKCLCFASTQEQAARICPITYHSNNKFSESNLEKFKVSTGMNNKLCAVEQLSEGVNIPNLKFGIILHSYGNERKASQKIFRFLRLNPDDCSTIHILCYKDTIDEQWVKSALSGFNPSKVSYI
jgi:superfamily II DNA or RNA helicase